jgi:hypothetical protein
MDQGSPSSKEAKVEEQVEVQEPGAGEKTLVFSVVLQSRTALFHVASSVMFEVALAAILSLGFNFLLDHCYVSHTFFALLHFISLVAL